MAILKHIVSKSSSYGAALEYLIFKHDELRKTPILDQNGNRIMRDEFYLDGLNCEPYSFDAACRQLNREYQKNKNKNEIKSHHYIISFDPRDRTENCLTGKRAQELGLEYAKANFPGHQALVCTHMDGHNGSGNIHVHIVINSLRKLDVPKQPFMERPIDCKAGYKHHVTNEYLKHLQKSLMDLCRREFLHQVDLLSPSRTGVTEAEYWAQRRLDEKKQKIETEGFTPNPTKFQTQKQLIRDAVAAAREKAISYEDFQDILQDEYNIFVKTQRGRYSYLPPERNKFISERSLGESCKRECLEGFFVQNAEKNLRYKEEPILIFTTRTKLRLVVDLQENVKAQENLAYALKVKISNLQRMAETLVWVQENNINDLRQKTLGIRVLLYWMSPNGKQALLQYRFRNVKNLKIYLRQIYRDSLKTYNNRAMRLLREECRHEFWASYEPASDNSGGKPENECWERCYPCSWKSSLYLRFAEERSEGYCNHAVCCGASHVL